MIICMILLNTFYLFVFYLYDFVFELFWRRSSFFNWLAHDEPRARILISFQEFSRALIISTERERTLTKSWKVRMTAGASASTAGNMTAVSSGKARVSERGTRRSKVRRSKSIRRTKSATEFSLL